MEKDNHHGKIAFALLILFLLLFLGFASFSHKNSNDIRLSEITVTQNGAQTLLTLGFTGKPDFHSDFVATPPHLIIDVRNCIGTNKFKNPIIANTIINRIHSERISKESGMELLVDLAKDVTFTEALDPSSNKLIVTIIPVEEITQPTEVASPAKTVAPVVKPVVANKKSVKTTKSVLNKPKTEAKHSESNQDLAGLAKELDQDVNSQKVKTPTNQTNFLTKNPVLDISTNDLGWIMPLTLGAQYSSIFGTIFHGQFSHSLGAENALAMLFDGGAKEYRVNGTFGHAFSENQRLKLTGEYLAQDLNLSYITGSLDKWVGQGAIGATYEYLFPGKFIHDLNLNAFYSKAQSKELDEFIFADPDSPSGWSANDRRIAGGKDRSASLGLDLLPFKTTLLGAQLNYDNVIYDMKYEITPQNPDPSAKGLGGTLTLEQLLGKYFKVKLLGSKRKIYDNYQAEIDWLVKNNAEHHFEVSLVGQHLVNDNSDQSIGFTKTTDNRIGLNFTYQFGNGQSKGQGYTFGSVGEMGDITNWTNNPAVHMEKVLAVKDEQVRYLSSSELPGIGDFEADGVFGENLSLDISNHFVFGFGSLVDIINNFTAKTLATAEDQNLADYGLALTHNGNTITLSGTPHKETATEEDPNKTVVIPVEITNSLGQKADGVFHLRISDEAPKINIPEQDFKVGVPVTNNSYGKDITADIADGASSLKSITYSEVLSEKYNLQIKIEADNHIYIEGTPSQQTPTAGETIKVTIKNSGGIENSGSFLLKITSDGKSVTPYKVTTYYGKNITEQNPVKIADIDTYGDKKFKIVNQADIEKIVAPYNLIVTTPDANNHVEVLLTGDYFGNNLFPGPNPNDAVVKKIPIEVNKDSNSKASDEPTAVLTIDMAASIGEYPGELIFDQSATNINKKIAEVYCGANDKDLTCKLVANTGLEGSGLSINLDAQNNLVLTGTPTPNQVTTYNVHLAVSNQKEDSDAPLPPQSQANFKVKIIPDKTVKTYDSTTLYGKDYEGNDEKKIADINTAGDHDFKIMNEDEINQSISPYSLDVRPVNDNNVEVYLKGKFDRTVPLPGPIPNTPITKNVTIEVNSNTLKQAQSGDLVLTIDMPATIGNIQDYSFDQGKAVSDQTVLTGVVCGNTENKCTVNASGLDNSGLSVALNAQNDLVLSGTAGAPGEYHVHVTAANDLEDPSNLPLQSTADFKIKINPFAKIDPAVSEVSLKWGDTFPAKQIATLETSDPTGVTVSSNNDQYLKDHGLKLTYDENRNVSLESTADNKAIVGNLTTGDSNSFVIVVKSKNNSNIQVQSDPISLSIVSQPPKIEAASDLVEYQYETTPGTGAVVNVTNMGAPFTSSQDQAKTLTAEVTSDKHRDDFKSWYGMQLVCDKDTLPAGHCYFAEVNKGKGPIAETHAGENYCDGKVGSMDIYVTVKNSAGDVNDPNVSPKSYKMQINAIAPYLVSGIPGSLTYIVSQQGAQSKSIPKIDFGAKGIRAELTPDATNCAAYAPYFIDQVPTSANIIQCPSSSFGNDVQRSVKTTLSGNLPTSCPNLGARLTNSGGIPATLGVQMNVQRWP